MNGHTSGLRLFGSDETNTAQRERRRRMRSMLRARNKLWFGQIPDAERARCNDGNNRESLLIRA